MPLGGICDDEIDESADGRVVVQRDQRVHMILSSVAAGDQILDHDDAERLEDEPAERVQEPQGREVDLPEAREQHAEHDDEDLADCCL